MTTRTESYPPFERNTLDVPGPVAGEIYLRMAQIMAEVPAIAKGQRNKAQGYEFRGIDDVFNALHGLFAKHQVFILPEVLAAEYVQQLAGSNQNLATDARLLIRWHFVTIDGSSVSMTVQGESRDYADKATGQAMSSGYKTGLLEMFLIPLEGTPEADNESPTIEDPMTPAEAEEAVELATKVRLVEMLDTKEAAKEFWDTHQGMPHDELLAAAQQKMLDDTKLEDTPIEEDPGNELLATLMLGSVPTRKTQLQQGINDMDRLGTLGAWLVTQLAAAGKPLTELTVKELKTLYAGLQHELANA